MDELERRLNEQTARAEAAEKSADEEKRRAEKTISDLAAAIEAAVDGAVAGIRGETALAVTAVLRGEEKRTAAAVAAAVEVAVAREKERGREALAEQEMVVNMVLFN